MDALRKPRTLFQHILRALAEAAMSVTHHDIDDAAPEYIHEVQAMERKFANILRGKMKGKWSGRAALTQEDDHAGK